MEKIEHIDIEKLIDDVNKNKSHYCLICGKECESNVCIECEAVQESRKVYFYSRPEIDNLSKINFEYDFKAKKTKYILDHWRSIVTYTDLSCYTDEERKIYFDRFFKEINDLTESESYNYNVFNHEGKPMQSIVYLYDNMRKDNIRNYCQFCRIYPCRYCRDSQMNIGIIKKCATTQKVVV